jgi:hypothetical protein
MSIKSDNSNVYSCNKTRWWTPRLAGPVIAAAVIRFTLLAVALSRGGVNNLIDSATGHYLDPGRNLLLHGRFFANGVPDLLRTPGYSLFIAVTSLAGLPAAAAANVILSVFSVILVWRLGRAVLGDDRIALGAAWIFAFEPISIIYSVFLVSEPLFLTLFLLSMERLAEFLRGRRLPVLAVAGLWLATATFVRPITYYLPFALAVGLFVVLARVPDLRWKAPAVLLISVLPWLAAWQVRNWVETGYRGFSSISEINLFFYVAPGITAQIEHRYIYDVLTASGYPNFRDLWIDNHGQIYLSPTYLALHPEQAAWSQGQRLAFMRSESTHVIRTHYGVYLHMCLISTFRTLFEVGAGRFEVLLNRHGPYHIVGLAKDKGMAREVIELFNAYPWVAAEKAAFAVVLLGLYLFAARGVFRIGMHNTYLWLLLGISLYIIAVSAVATGPLGEARYRLPVMPVVCIFAAAGFWRINQPRDITVAATPIGSTEFTQS